VTEAWAGGRKPALSEGRSFGPSALTEASGLKRVHSGRRQTALSFRPEHFVPGRDEMRSGGTCCGLGAKLLESLRMGVRRHLGFFKIPSLLRNFPSSAGFFRGDWTGSAKLA
jgi:hypothetical protein